MKVSKYFLYLFCTLSFFSSQAQDIIWADELSFQFNNYEEANFSGKQALGAPDALPSGSLHQKAFRMKSESAYGTLIVSYKNPTKVNHLVIIENNHPGNIVEIALHDAQGQKYIVFKAEPQKTINNHRAMVIPIAETSYLVKKVEVNVNTTQKPGWAQIDAIGIANTPSTDLIEKELYSYGQANVQQEFAFATKKENLGPAINSPFIEAKPLISPDGKTLYFTRQNHPENTRGKKDEGDIYVSTLNNGVWSEARNLGNPVNDNLANGVTSVSPDGNTLLLINQYNPSGIAENGTSISHRTRQGWSYPEPVNIDEHVNNSNYADYYLANNGKAMLMAIQSHQTFGDQDLYVSFIKDDESWSAPLNLGDIINTSKAEFSPFLAADNKTLYFASEGHAGFGGSDIFYTKRLDDSWEKWSTPKNLGKEINTPSWDAYYAIDAAGKYAYFVSNTGSSSEIKNNSKDIYRIALTPEFKPEPVVLVSGKVFDEKTKMPISADIIFEILPLGEEQGRAISSPEDGTYKIILPMGSNYGFMAKAKGYVAVNENLNLSSVTNYQEIERDLYLVPIEVGAVIKMNNIFFQQSKATLLEESFPELNRLYEFMRENNTVEIELGGHTDNQGLAHLNVKLSKDRVEMVKEFLVNKGISGGRIKTEAYGGTKPIASNRSEETRALNRRVEITILKK